MRSGARIAEVGRQLLSMACGVTADANERYLLTHDALQRLLNDHAQLSQANAQHLRSAISAAAIANGIKQL